MVINMRRMICACYIMAATFPLAATPSLAVFMDVGSGYCVAVNPGSTESTHVVVEKNGEPFLDLDMKEYLAAREILAHEAGPISPDGQYVPILAGRFRGGKSDLTLLLIDVVNRNITRKNMFHDITDLIIMSGKMEWITTRKIGFRLEHHGEYYLYDFDSASTASIMGENQIVWDAAGQHRASVFYKSEFYGALSLLQQDLEISEALKYDGYWVYPKPLFGWRSPDEYIKWRQDIALRELGKGPRQEPIVRSHGVAMEKNHVLSAPVFIGATQWVGFYEQVFELGRWDKILESNAVLLNAEGVLENPPRPKSIVIKKKGIAPIVPRDEHGFPDLLATLSAKWNGSTSRLELWKSERFNTECDSFRKICEVSVDLSQMELGIYRQITGAEYINWSRIPEGVE